MSEFYPVTVVIPAHNAVRTLARAVTSAAKGRAGEIIIIDDASTDSTGALAEQLKLQDFEPEIVVIHSESLYPAGVCHARNAGITRARYQFIIPLDADDAFTPDGLKLLYEGRAPKTVVYGGQIKAETSEPVTAPPPERLAQKNLTGATFGFWRQDWLRAGGYHNDFNLGCEDWAFMAALVSIGCELYRIDEPVYIYSSGGKRAARCLRYADTLRQLLAEHYPAVFNAQQSH